VPNGPAGQPERGSVVVRRVELHDGLREEALRQRIPIEFGARLDEVVEGERGVEARFADGRRAEALCSSAPTGSTRQPGPGSIREHRSRPIRASSDSAVTRAPRASGPRRRLSISSSVAARSSATSSAKTGRSTGLPTSPVRSPHAAPRARPRASNGTSCCASYMPTTRYPSRRSSPAAVTIYAAV
jgi:hypothetical protein